MELLKKGFAPKDTETINTYINLIYSENYEENDNSELDDDIPTAGTRQHWQYAHRQFRQKMKNTHVQRQENQEQNKNQKQPNTKLDPYRVEYLPSVSTRGLLQKVRAAIYLSMDELWAVPAEIALVSTYLDPRFKHFNWSTEEKRNEAQNLVELLYEDLKRNLSIPDDIEEILTTNTRNNEEDDDDFFSELEVQTSSEENDELTCYVKLEPIGIKENPLEW